MRKDIYYWIIIALLVVVFLQGRGYHNDLAAQSRMFQSSLSNVREEVRALRNQLARMEQEEAWYSRPQVEFVGSDELASEGYFTITWTFRELFPDADVELDYQVAGGAWQEAEVEHISGLTYRAHLAIPVTFENMPYTVEFSSSSGREQRVITEERKSEGPATVSYSITARNGEGARSAGESFDLAAVTGLFQVNVDASGEAFRLSLMRRHYQRELQWDNVVSVQAIALDQNLSELVRFTFETMAIDEWHGVMEVDTRQVEELVIEVTFEDGTVAVMPLDTSWMWAD